MNFRAILCSSVIVVALIFSFAARAQETEKPPSTLNTRPTTVLAEPAGPAKTDTVQIPKRPTLTHIATVPKPPPTVGCYTYSANAAGARQWQTVPCLSPEEASRIPHLGTGGKFGTPGLSGALGIQSGNLSVQFAPGNWQVTDSGTGKTAFSVQMNTNGFSAVCQSSNPLPPFAVFKSPCINGDTGWVQFTYQTSDWGRSADSICIWNVDITKQYYTFPQTWLSCLAVGKAGFWGINQALVLNGWVDVTHHVITLTAILPWSGDWKAVVSPDWFSLCWNGSQQCSWTQVSGTIYGAGNGSTANFGPNTQLQTSLESLTFSAPNNDTSAYLAGQFGGTSTAESNNLTPYYFALPTPSCNGGYCSVTYNTSNIPPK